MNKHVLRANKGLAKEDRKPPFRISRGKYGKPFYAYYVTDMTDAQLVYDADNPLPCGATVWIAAKTLSALLIEDGIMIPYEELKKGRQTDDYNAQHETAPVCGAGPGDDPR